ncbi:glycoside hydrolase family 15 protein [Haloarcula marina]|uniref:glycoside hydrolase family 15 protein n=1 Tax=Haloarcula marina TaxID=2961574 RepID=UPI0020B70AF9|nr:glycoside hydrolase family 15 protein [Halomicroarcula marina]
MDEPPAAFRVASDKDALMSTPKGDSQHTMVTANSYADNPRTDWNGALIEETSAFRSDVELFYNLHTLIWDPKLGQTLDCRNDAVTSDVDWISSQVPEIDMTNHLRFADGSEAEISQQAIASVDRPGLLIRNQASFADSRERTIFTVSKLGITAHDHEHHHAEQTANVRHEDDCDVIVARDDDDYRYVAFAQRRGENRRFDGYRIGLAGQSTGPNRSAWTEIYEENNGWLDTNERATGDLDIGFGLYCAPDEADSDTVEWLTAVGFGKSEQAAVDHALETLDTGYEADRTAFVEAWKDWHESVGIESTGTETVDNLYERSLTSIKAAQDGCCATIAGAFKPHDMTYKFIWPRDQVIIAQALIAAGATKEAALAVDWLDRVQITEETYDDRGIDRRGTWWQNYYTTGESHWRALQLDQVGGPIYAHWLLWTETGANRYLTDHYEMSKRAAEFLLGWDNGWGFPKPHQDPWEEVWGHTTEGSAAAIAGLRCMAEMADAKGESTFADRCRERADTWASNMSTYCFKSDTQFGNHYVTADKPEGGYRPAPDERPDAAIFMAYWPWNVLDANDPELIETAELADDPRWCADETACVGRYPGDRYTPSGTPEDGGWPLCEAYADMVRWQSGLDDEAVVDHLDESSDWTTSAGLLPERVDGDGTVSWNSNLQWSQAMYILLTESHDRGEPFGLAPAE